MYGAHAYFPVLVYARRERTLSPRDIAILSLTVAICCAAIVFAMLYNFDRGYPVAAVNNQPLPLAGSPLAAAGQRAPRSAIDDIVSGARVEDAAKKPEPIARTHDQLLALERLGDRNYIEFSVARSGKFQPIGPVEIGLWRTDLKHASASVSVLLNGRRIDFKRLSLNEPVSIPTGRSQQLELVVNGVTRTQITGYLAEPKNTAVPARRVP